MKENFFKDIKIVNANIGCDKITTADGKKVFFIGIGIIFVKKQVITLSNFGKMPLYFKIPFLINSGVLGKCGN
jgi:hypothetical protein